VRRFLSSIFLLGLLAATTPVATHQGVDPELLLQVKPRKGSPPGNIPRLPGDPLVEKGRKLFFEETFGGNGRTCGTCHRAERNFTIDVAFIATLPSNDPLFVHETNRDLAALENAYLLRDHALFLENLDGFDQPGVFRSAQHTLGLRFTTAPAGGGDIENSGLLGALGWSGDGAPGTGTLREFAVGAIVQHMPKRLDRHPGLDFRLPTEDELDALEAFQLSLGRQEAYIVDPADPNALTFRDPFVSEGQRLFHDAPARTGANRSCGSCHHNAGSNTPEGIGANRNTGTQLHPRTPACLLPGVAPLDGGFGGAIDPITGQPRTAEICGQTLPSFGDGRFNSQSLVEAADTPPFFHNNIVDTIEEAVAFYTSDTFSLNRAFVLSDRQVDQVAAFLRAINAVDNIASARRSLDVGVGRPNLPTVHKSDALRDINDAIDVLTQGPNRLFAATRAVDSLRSALANIDRGVIVPARVDLERARQLIVGPPKRGVGAQASR
jgi:cytochrome c peroxidase